MKKGFQLGLMLLLLLLPAQAVQAGNVSSESELRAELGNNPVVTTNITITQPLIFESGSTVIDLKGHTLTLGNNIEEMFQIRGENVSVIIRNGTLDGAEKGRLLKILGAEVSLEQVTVKNGSTDTFQKKLDESGVNRQSYQGGAIYLEQEGKLSLLDTVFRDNYAKKATPAVEHPNDPALAAHGGAIYCGGKSIISMRGGAFYDNYSGTTETKSGTTGEGGAIKLEGGSQLYINYEGSEGRTIFDGNHNYVTASNVGGYQGGAIEATNSIIKAYNVDFVVKGGFDTGGAIKFEKSGQKLDHNIIKDSTFKLVGGQLPTKPEASTYFGTSGGAIMSENSYLTVTNTTFTMEKVAEDSKYPEVAFAGGFIDVVGGGELNLYDSSLTGNGASWNAAGTYKSAKYGGAIAFENGASAKAHIKGTTLKNFMVDHTGGIISVGHRNGATKEYGNTTVDLRIENSTLQNAHAYTYNAASAGAGLYIAPGSNVVVAGGTIEYMTANYGAAVYNKGNLTFEDHAQVKNNTTTQMGAGVMNDGYLNVHSAVFGNNVKSKDAFFNSGNHQFKAEHSGDNIYAKQDVIVGTDASFDGNDVRVFDKTSAILLSGPRNSVINVSISEAPNAANDQVFQEDFAETANRYVGYLVGKGVTDADLKAAYKPAETAAGYTPTPEDAKKLHYVSRTVEASKIATVEDHTSPALWDYVYDPEASTIVLGQRAKMIYHSNHSSATMEGGMADTEPAGQKLEQLYTFYRSGDGAPKVSMNHAAATELTATEVIPSLTVANESYGFRGWYKGAWKEKPIYNEEQKTPQDSEKYDFAKATFTGTWHKDTNTQITDILSVEEKNTLHTYAVYQQGRITVRVKKVWNASDKEDVTFVLKGGEKEIEKTLPKDSAVDYVEFQDLKMVDQEGNPLFDKYTVEEKGTKDGKVTLGNHTYAVAVAYENDMMAEAEKEPQTKYYTVTNTQLTDVQVTKEWQGGVTQPTEKVEAELYKSVGGGQPTLVKTEELTAAGGWKKVFADLPVTEEVGGQTKPIAYSVKEKGMTDNGTVQLEGKKYQVTISGSQENGFTIANRQYTDMGMLTPGTTQLKVSKTWVGEVAEAEIQVQLYKNGEPEGSAVALHEGNGWTYTFEQLPVVDTIQQAQGNVYEIKEVGEADGVITLNGHSYSVKMTQPSAKEVVITNTYMPKKQIKVTKEWAGEKTIPAAAVYVQLYRTVDGTESQVENGMKELTAAGGWTYTFENLPGVQKEGDSLKPITYSVREVQEKDGKIQLDGRKYEVRVTGDEANGFVITNKQYTDMGTLIPGTTTMKVSKIWKGTAGAKEITVQLLKNGEAFGKAVALNETGNWSHTFTDLPVADKIDQKEPNRYTVQEVGEKDGMLVINDRKYTVSYDAKETETVITNTEIREEPPKPDHVTPGDNGTPESKKGQTVQESRKKAPKTADAGSLAGYTLALLLSAGGILQVTKKRTETQ